MANLGNIFANINVKTQGLDRGLKKAESNFKSFTKNTAKSMMTVSEALTGIKAKVKTVDDGLPRVQRNFTSFGTTLSNSMVKAGLALGGVVVGLFAVRQAIRSTVEVVKDVVRITDTFSLLEGRIKLVTKSTEELRFAQSGLLAIANETRSDYASVLNLYARFGRVTDNLAVSQTELLGVVKTINQAIIVSGATAMEASNGLIQLSQGLASNTLRGDELRSVSEQLPRLFTAIADSIGVTRGQLREMAMEGAISGQVVIDAMISQRKIIEEEFLQMTRTVSQSFVVLGNNVKNIVFEISKNAEINKILADSIIGISDAIVRWVKENKTLIEQDLPKKIEEIVSKVKETGRAIVDTASSTKKAIGFVTEAVNKTVPGRLFIGLTDTIRFFMDTISSAAQELVLDPLGFAPMQRQADALNKVLDETIRLMNKREQATASAMIAFHKSGIQFEKDILAFQTKDLPEFGPLTKEASEFAEAMHKAMLPEGDETTENVIKGMREQLKESIKIIDERKKLEKEFSNFVFTLNNDDKAEAIKALNEFLATFEGTINAADIEITKKLGLENIEEQFDTITSTLKDAAEAWVRVVEAPIEEMKRRFKELQDIFDAGFLQPETFKRASEQIVQDYKSAMDKLKGKTEETTSFMDQLARDTASSMRKGFSDLFFKTMKNDWEDFGDFVASVNDAMLRNLADALANFASTALQDFFDSLNNAPSKSGSGGGGGILSSIAGFFGFAKGGITDIAAFAKGVILNSPTVFPMANGGIGLAGEAGSEAILPLTKVGGQLGVSAQTSTPRFEFNIINQTGQDIEAEQGDIEQTPEKIVSDLILRKKASSRKFRDTLGV